MANILLTLQFDDVEEQKPPSLEAAFDYIEGIFEIFRSFPRSVKALSTRSLMTEYRSLVSRADTYLASLYLKDCKRPSTTAVYHPPRWKVLRGVDFSLITLLLRRIVH
jgi:hypothetical protein